MSSVFRSRISSEMVAANQIAFHCRKTLGSKLVKHNYPAVLRLAFNDAMTYNPETSKGGTVMGLKFRASKLKKYNKPYIGVLEALLYNKNLEADYRFDTMSESDYLQAHAITAIKDADGPNLCEYIRVGRKDVATEEELEGMSEVPQPEDGITKFRDAFSSKGFNEKETVALAFIYSFGTFRPRHQMSYTNRSVFNNDYFKYLIDDSQDKKFALDNILLDDSALKEFVELFADKNKEFFDAFCDAYIKLQTLGNDDQNLRLEFPEYQY